MLTPTPTVSGPLLQQLSERIERLTGLHFPGERFADLERGLAQAARELGCRDAQTFARSLLSREIHASDLEALADSLTIGETHFFRDPRAFTFLETTLLPALIAARRNGNRQLRIWSAGCASGEEPYSIAILLHRLLPDLSQWQITILGTDINPKVLARAAAGTYTEWSFRDAPTWVKPRYFTACSGKRYEIQPWIKRMVRFACLNLAEDVYPSVLNNTNALNLIICRNVLLYFATTGIPPVVQRFRSALVDGGQLVMGSVEASLMTFPGFSHVPAIGMSLYRKEDTLKNLPQGNGRLAPAAEVARLQESYGNRPNSGQSGYQTPSRPCPPEPPAEVSLTKSQAGRDATYVEAYALFAAGRYFEAQTSLRSSPSPRPDNDPQLAGLLAQCHANLGELAEALLWCERALKIAKTDSALHFLRAGILQELQRDDEAMLALRSVLFLDAGHVLAHYRMANLHRRGNRTSMAAKHIANARQLLAGRDESEELSDSGGLTVGRLNAILAAMTGLKDNEEDSKP